MEVKIYRDTQGKIFGVFLERKPSRLWSECPGGSQGIQMQAPVIATIQSGVDAARVVEKQLKENPSYINFGSIFKRKALVPSCACWKISPALFTRTIMVGLETDINPFLVCSRISA